MQYSDDLRDLSPVERKAALKRRIRDKVRSGREQAQRRGVAPDPLSTLLSMGVEDTELLKCASSILNSLPNKTLPTMDELSRAVHQHLREASTELSTRPLCEEEEEEEAPPE
jgi:hypothetical protein